MTGSLAAPKLEVMISRPALAVLLLSGLAAAARAGELSPTAGEALPTEASVSPGANALGALPRLPEAIAVAAAGEGRPGAPLARWRRLFEMRDKPRTAYRGQTGAMMLFKEPLSPAQKDNIDRLRGLLASPGAAAEDEAELARYLFGIVEGQRAEANFNLSKSQARSWSESSYPELEARWFSRNRQRTWASEAFRRITDIRLVLRVRLPRGQRYWRDRFRDDDFGIMTRVPHASLAALPLDELVYEARVGGQRYRGGDPRIAPYLAAQFRFMKQAKEAIVSASPDAAPAWLAAKLRDAYQDSGLSSAR